VTTSDADQAGQRSQDRERYRGETTLPPRPREPGTMSNGPNQGDESTSTADLSTPTEPEVTDLDLRAEASEPDSELLPAVPTPPASQPVPEATSAESQVTLASLAFRLFSTIEDQIARDPNAAALTGLAGRLDVLERGVASSISKADALTDLSERLDDIDAQLAAPDPHASALSSLNDRLARVEHRMAAPHPHTATINSLVERIDEAEAKGTPHHISVLTERLDMVEGRVPAPEDLTRLTDRVTAIERRLTSNCQELWIDDLRSGGDVLLGGVGVGVVGGPFLVVAVDEDGACSHERDEVWGVDFAPSVLGGVEELVGHRQRCFA